MRALLKDSPQIMAAGAKIEFLDLVRSLREDVFVLEINCFLCVKRPLQSTLSVYPSTC